MLTPEENVEQVTQERETTPQPRRRRAASRPAGAPSKAAPVEAQKPTEAPGKDARVKETPAKAQKPADSPVPEASAEAQKSTDSPAPEAPAEDLTPKRRRASTTPSARSTTTRRRKVDVDKPDAEEAPEAKDAAPAAEDKPKREPAAIGRGRQRGEISGRAQARAIEAKPAEEAAADAAEPAQADDEKPAAPPTRRRRASRQSAAPEKANARAAKSSTAADPDEDPIAAALRAAEEVAEARKAVLSDPFITAEAREEQLAALAESIAADSTAKADDDDDETDAEDADDDTPDDDSDETSDDDSDDDDSDDDDSDDDDSDDDDSDDEDSDDSEERPTRRRRRRGGRRRRRSSSRPAAEDSDGSDDDDSDDSDDTDDGDDTDNGDDDTDTDNDSDSDADGGTVRRRRRRRRRPSGGSSDSSGDSSQGDEVTGIEGSTRMEAKRQRRKESRAAGRRRAPILSEAEFLARRESVDRKLVIRQAEDYTQLAVVEDDVLVEHYVDKASATSLIGNVYLGKVQNVLPSMEAAFIDIGRGRNAVLYAGEVDWSSFEVTGENRKVENVLKSGQSILVQVTKDPVGAKGARLTGHISLPGRYIVYSPGGHLSGISRKLPDTERIRLRGILAGLIAENESVIVRTAAEGIPEEELVRDVNRLKAQWEVIEKKSKKGGSPQALYSEPDLTLRIVRDLFTEDFGKLVVQGDRGAEDAFDAIAAYVSHVAPHLADRVERFEADGDGKDVFAEYKIDEQIAKALDRKVFLPSGGSLVIDRTEAMTVIDVNTGRFTGAGGNLEATVTSNNLEAAEEVVRQLRLRDIGGIIVIDFIDMVLPNNRDLLLRRLVEGLSRDRTRHQVSEVTSLGLVQMTRKRIGTGLQEAFTEPCEHCNGVGYHRFEEPVDSQAPSDGGDRRGGNNRRRGGRGR